MEVTAQLRNIRISPRKVRLVANAIRGLAVPVADVQLQYLNKKASAPVLKLLRSAVANAEHNYKLTSSTLFVKSIQVDSGLTLERWKPRAQGRATPIAKKASHVKLVLAAKKESKKEALQAVKKAARTTRREAKKTLKKTEHAEKIEPVKAEEAK